ncbi:MAG: hypothetical protein ACI959_001191 [Limisphaerales bacterium]|jgi:hypothetical protein
MTLQELQATVSESISNLFMGFVDGFGLMIGALIVLFIFWIVARIVRGVISRVLKGINFDTLIEKVKLDVLFEKMGVKSKPSKLIGHIAYIMIMVVGLVAASDQMGWEIVSKEVSKLISLIPLIVSGMIIFIIGFYVAGIIKEVLTSATESLGVEAGKILASGIYYFLLIIITLSTLEHIGVNVSILSDNFQLIIGAIVIAGAISYGLASRELLQNTLSTYYGRNTFEVGQRIKVDGTSG